MPSHCSAGDRCARYCSVARRYWTRGGWSSCAVFFPEFPGSQLSQVFRCLRSILSQISGQMIRPTLRLLSIAGALHMAMGYTQSGLSLRTQFRKTGGVRPCRNRPSLLTVKSKAEGPIYMDYSGTTPVDKVAIEV
jgi:hypothetical protein